MADREDTKITFTEAQQAHVNKLVGDARVSAREKAQTEYTTRATKDKDAAEQAALVAQNEWQTLAETREVRVKELEPLEAQIEVYEEVVKELLKERITTLGDSAKTAISGLPKGMATIEKLKWLSKNEGLFQGKGDGVGTPGRPETKSTGKKTPVTIGKRPIRL